MDELTARDNDEGDSISWREHVLNLQSSDSVAVSGGISVSRGSGRTLDREEARRLYDAWPKFGAEVEPLHTWMGWTPQELWNYEKRGRLPE